MMQAGDALAARQFHIGVDGDPFAGQRSLMRTIARVAGVGEPAMTPFWRLGLRWSARGHQEDLAFYSFSAPGSLYAEDLTEVVDEHEWITEECRLLHRLEGFLMVVDPRYDAVRRMPARLRILKNSIEAFGRAIERVPVVFVVPRGRPTDAELEPTRSLQHRYLWPDAPFVEVDVGTAEGVTPALNALLDRVAAARTRPRRESYPQPILSPATETVPLPAAALQPLLEKATRRDDRDLLNELLQLWRTCAAVTLAELIDALSYALRPMRPVTVNHASWIKQCRNGDPTSLPVLLDTLLLREQGVELRQHVSHVLERLDGLRWWKEDPRVTPRLDSALADLTRYRKKSVQKALFRTLEWHADPRRWWTYRRHQQDIAAIRPPLSYRSDDLILSIPQPGYDGIPSDPGTIPVTLRIPHEHRDAWNALVERIRRPLPRPEDMAAIAEDPHSEGLRRELATGMLERGDPRGEFILLQLKKATDSLSPEELEREQALKRTYAWDWLGPLADVVDVENSVFEKGYPVKVTVWTPNTRALRDVIGRPEWATVREIRWGGDPLWEEEAADPELVNHPVMKSLQAVTTKMPEDPAELEALRRVAWAR